MPTFNFTSPEGKNYTINGPEGATKEQAFQILQTQIGGGAPPVPTRPQDQIPGPIGLPKQAPPQQPAIAPPPQGGFLDALKGAGETALTLGTGAVAAPIGAARGLYEGLTGGKLGTEAGTRQAEKKGGELAERLTYAPKTEQGKQYTGALGDFFKAAGVEALGGLGGEVSALGEAAKVAKPLIATKAAPAVQALREAPEALGKVGSAAKSVAGKAITKGLGIDQDALALAQKAQDYGINVRPDMISNNKVAKMIGEALEKVPLSGSKAEARQEAFNVALIKQIGGDPKAKRLNPEVFAAALNKSGKEIGRIGEQYGVKIDAPIQTVLKDFGKEAKSFETKDVRNIVNSYLKEIQEKTTDGTLDGTAFKKLNSKISRQAASTSNGDLKNALSGLQEIMHDALEKSIPKDELKAWNTARTQYAKAKTIEPLVAKSKYGDISGPELMSRVTADKAGKSRMAKGAAGDLGDLARIGQLIKEPGSSGTAERGLAYGILGGGALANPAATAGVYGAANLYNRLGSYLIPPPPKP